MQQTYDRTHIRLNETESQQLQYLIKTMGQSAPQLFKQALFKKPLPSPLFSNQDAKSLMSQMQRVGNNLNQIAKQLNSGIREGFHKEFIEILEQVKVIRQYICGVYGHR